MLSVCHIFSVCGAIDIPSKKIDISNNASGCSNKAEVQTNCSAQLTLNCPNPINIEATPTQVPVSWNLPTSSTSCTPSGVAISQTNGPANGSNFAIGVYTISYYAVDSCQVESNCSFTITITEPSGQPDLTISNITNLPTTATPNTEVNFDLNNIGGQLVHRTIDTTIDISSFSKGMYFIKVEIGHSISMDRLMVE